MMEESPDREAAERPSDYGEESHEAEWAAMQLTVVRDCTAQSLQQGAAAVVEDSSDSEASNASDGEPGVETGPQPNTAADAVGPATAHQRGPVVVHRATVLDDSSDSEDSSDEAAPSQAVTAVGEESVVGDFLDLFKCDAEGNPKADATVVTDIASLLRASNLNGSAIDANNSSGNGGDLDNLSTEVEVATQGLDNEDLVLPSIEEAQSHLESIRSRRNMLQALSAKYTPPAQPVKSGGCVQQSGPKPSTCEPPARTERDAAEAEAARHEATPQEGTSQHPKHPIGAKPKQVFGPPPRPEVEQASQVMDQFRICLGNFSKLPSSAKATDSKLAAINDTGFTIGGSVRKKDGSAASVPNSQKQVRSKTATSAGSVPTWTLLDIDSKKLQAGKEQEAKRSEELWQQFLPGDDMPVGSDALPTPDQYFA